MPEFQMPMGSWRDAIDFSNLDDFAQGYVEAMFFTSTGDAGDEELEHATFADLAAETVELIVRDCDAFQTAHAALLDRAYQRDYDAKQAGRDYWFTRNGHGVGYWDRKVLEADGLGDELSDAAGRCEVDLYRGDDGKLYF